MEGIRKMYLVVMLMMLYNIMIAQDKNIAEIRSYYNKMKTLSISAIDANKTIYMDYSVVMAPLDKHISLQHSSLKAWVNARQTKLINDKMSIYKDEKESLTLLPEQKMIVMADALPMDKNYLKKGILWNSVQDTMFTMSSVKDSKEYTSSTGELLKKTTLVMNKKGQGILHINSMVFIISEKTHLLKEMQINYEASGKTVNGVAFEYMDIVINNMQVLDDSSKVFPKDIESMFFSSGLTLKKEFLGYKLIDKRNITEK